MFKLPTIRFTTWTFCTFGRFDTGTFRYIPGRFATGQQSSSYIIANYNFHTGGETSRKVVKRPGIETSKGAKRPLANHPGGKPSR